MFNLGGKRPQTATLTLAGGKIDVDGAFEKGETLVLEVVCVVNKVAQKDKHDTSTGQVVSCEQQHTARITDLRVTQS